MGLPINLKKYRDELKAKSVYSRTTDESKRLEELDHLDDLLTRAERELGNLQKRALNESFGSKHFSEEPRMTTGNACPTYGRSY
jgi:hypothetical protein